MDFLFDNCLIIIKIRDDYVDNNVKKNCWSNWNCILKNKGMSRIFFKINVSNRIIYFFVIYLFLTLLYRN